MQNAALESCVMAAERLVRESEIREDELGRRFLIPDEDVYFTPSSLGTAGRRLQTWSRLAVRQRMRKEKRSLWWIGTAAPALQDERTVGMRSSNATTLQNFVDVDATSA